MKKNIIICILIYLLSCSFLIGQNNFRTDMNIIENDNSRIATISVLNGEEKTVTLKKELDKQSSIPVAIAMSNGNLVLLNSLEGNLDLYNQSGEIIFSNKFYSLAPYQEQTIKYSINSKGIILLVSEDNANNLYLVSNNGEIENLTQCAKGLITGLSSSFNGEAIIYSIVNWNGNNLNKTSVLLDLENDNEKIFSLDFENGVFNERSKLFVGHNKKSVFCLNYNNKKILWKKQLSEEEFYLGVNYSNSDIILVQAKSPKLDKGEWIYDEATIIKKNVVGLEKELHKVNTSFKTISIVGNQKEVEIKIDSKTILVN